MIDLITMVPHRARQTHPVSDNPRFVVFDAEPT
jgi:hypothetical protein